MQNRHAFLTTACLSVALVALPSAVLRAQDMGAGGARPADRAMQNNKAPVLPPGLTVKTGEGEYNDIRECMEEITDLALKKDGFDNLVSRLVDRHRFGNIDETQFANLNAIVEQIRTDFKAKYGKDFDIPNDAKPVVYPGTIVHAEVNDPARLVDAWPVEASPSSPMGGMDDRARPAAERDRPGLSNADKSDKDRKEDKAERKQLDRGQNVALYTMPASHGLPQLTVSLVQEPAWHVDIPDTVSIDRLRTNLENHLTMVKNARDQWPADINDAYALISHHVLLALYDVNGSDMQHNGMDKFATPPAGTLTPGATKER